MKQKLALCCALIHNPEILFLDEPTTGVDAVSRKEFWDMLIKLKNRGITIMVSTPYMDEASMCDRIALIDKGKILSVDTPENSLELFDQPLYELGAKDYYRCLLDARKYLNAKEVLPFGEYLHMTTGEHFDTHKFEEYLLNKNHSNIYIKKIKPTVEDVFLHLMKTEEHD
jgi:ABC-type multidrug transport system ATPase subunit